MYKETHVLKDPKTKQVCHYLDTKHPKAYRPVRRESWDVNASDLFEYCRDNPKVWILERIKPLVLENK